MRRTPTTDTLTVAVAAGAGTSHDFDAAYRDLASARAAYDAAAGDPERIALLADAAARLEQARHRMHLARRAV